MERRRRVDKRAHEEVYINGGTMEGQCGGWRTKKDGKVKKGKKE